MAEVKKKKSHKTPNALGSVLTAKRRKETQEKGRVRQWKHREEQQSSPTELWPAAVCHASISCARVLPSEGGTPWQSSAPLLLLGVLSSSLLRVSVLALSAAAPEQNRSVVLVSAPHKENVLLGENTHTDGGVGRWEEGADFVLMERHKGPSPALLGMGRCWGRGGSAFGVSWLGLRCRAGGSEWDGWIRGGWVDQSGVAGSDRGGWIRSGWVEMSAALWKLGCALPAPCWGCAGAPHRSPSLGVILLHGTARDPHLSACTKPPFLSAGPRRPSLLLLLSSSSSSPPYSSHHRCTTRPFVRRSIFPPSSRRTLSLSFPFWGLPLPPAPPLLPHLLRPSSSPIPTTFPPSFPPPPALSRPHSCVFPPFPPCVPSAEPPSFVTPLTLSVTSMIVPRVAALGSLFLPCRHCPTALKTPIQPRQCVPTALGRGIRANPLSWGEHTEVTPSAVSSPSLPTLR